MVSKRPFGAQERLAPAEGPALTGCFMLLRAPLVRQLGGFDERFFMYFEDFDISRRARRWARTVYVPQALRPWLGGRELLAPVQ